MCERIKLERYTQVTLACYIPTVFLLFFIAGYLQYNWSTIPDNNSSTTIHIPGYAVAIVWTIVVFVALSPLLEFLFKKFRHYKKVHYDLLGDVEYKFTDDNTININSHPYNQNNVQLHIPKQHVFTINDEEKNDNEITLELDLPLNEIVIESDITPLDTKSNGHIRNTPLSTTKLKKPTKPLPLNPNIKPVIKPVIKPEPTIESTATKIINDTNKFLQDVDHDLNDGIEQLANVIAPEKKEKSS
jgi:hypothetical protein